MKPSDRIAELAEKYAPRNEGGSRLVMPAHYMRATLDYLDEIFEGVFDDESGAGSLGILMALANRTRSLNERLETAESAVADLQRSRPLTCYDCGRRYENGPDLVVSDEDWAKIAPHDGNGVLCPNCMHDRFKALGVPTGSVKARFKSGPFAEDE